MSANNHGTGIEPYTEYSRTRDRCERCGSAVPRQALESGRCGLCGPPEGA